MTSNIRIEPGPADPRTGLPGSRFAAAKRQPGKPSVHAGRYASGWTA